MKHLYRILSVAIVVAVLGGSFGLAATASAQAPTATVNTGALNIRSGPGIGYGVVFSVYRGVAMTLLARNADASWVRISLDNGIQGWVNSRYIATSYPLFNLPVEGTGGPVGITATVTSWGLNVRTGPGVGYARLTSIARGTVVSLLARTADSSWVKVVLANGTVGWVNAGYVAPSAPIVSLPVEGVVVPPPVTPPPAYRTHVVQAGENLFRIALRYGVSMWDIARLNNIYDLRLIYAGQVLRIP
ncbi:MAG: SH3 domain-containing protein [Chloroflexota bacterium]